MVLRNDTPSPVRRRRSARVACPEPNANRQRLIDSAHDLQDGLRRLAHHAMAMRDEQRSRLGCTLQDEVCQLLVGINLHLLRLKQVVQGRTQHFDCDLAATRLLVARSARTAQLRITRRASQP